MFKKRPCLSQNTPTDKQSTGQLAESAAVAGTTMIGPGDKAPGSKSRETGHRDEENPAVVATAHPGTGGEQCRKMGGPIAATCTV
jgi:hypothetical protein